MSDTWTIGELAEHAARALRAGAPESSASPTVNGRVRDVPGERLIRWYTTIGLVDPPLTRRGRIARYGRRHLLQLVAVKRLQAAGHSIAQIQAALTGATDRMLESAAHLANHAHQGDGPRPDPPTHPGNRARLDDGAHLGNRARLDDGAHLGSGARLGETAPLEETTRLGDLAAPADAVPEGPARGRFWTERPGGGAAHEADGYHPGEQPGTVGEPGREGRSKAGVGEGRPHADERPTETDGGLGPRAEEAGGVVAGVRLGAGVRLVLDGARALSEEDVQAVLAAAGPLLAVLEERELT
ncbi:helix-turn-helix domain-containing protein [Nonomuraea sp. NPDC046802]|uniref:helix-turn-helix domain-containing protein n=1 Tax=Nonomuraea sp. NPDC046802 TaxID=3154919 RepID=UPI0034032C17